MITIPKRSLDSIIYGKKRMELVFVKDKLEHPYNAVKQNDILYFTPRGGLASIKARVSKVEMFNNIDFNRIQKIIGENRSLLSKDDMIIENKMKTKHMMAVHFDNVLDIKPFRLNDAALKNVKNSRWISMNKFFDMKDDLVVR